jgi:polyphosphate kinase 2 (PPK2 family)
MNNEKRTRKQQKHAQHSILREDYKAQLRVLQIELVKLQRQFIHRGDKILVLLEGRDAAGKDVCIKRIVAHLSPRETRVVALGKPTERESIRRFHAIGTKV